MIALAVMLLRALQYGAAALVMGLPAFMIYNRGTLAPLTLAWPRPLLAGAAGVLLIAAMAGLVAQTAMMAGDFTEALKLSTLEVMATQTALGAALVVRIVAAAVALVLALVMRPSATLWRITAGLGVIVSATFAWTGHGAATEGAGHGWHLAADVLHALAATLWVGALAAFLMLVLRRTPAPEGHDRALAKALGNFAGIGTVAVGVLVLTGLVNTVFLVGWSRVGMLVTTPYGGLLLFKLALFLAMLALAATNRFHLTPKLDTAGADLSGLRKSLAAEFALGLVILAVVAVLGVLAPPVAL